MNVRPTFIKVHGRGIKYQAVNDFAFKQEQIQIFLEEGIFLDPRNSHKLNQPHMSS